MVHQLERDMPELLSVFAFPPHLRRKLRTTNVIECCFVEVRRRTRPMVCFVNVESVDRILYSITAPSARRGVRSFIVTDSDSGFWIGLPLHDAYYIRYNIDKSIVCLVY